MLQYRSANKVEVLNLSPLRFKYFEELKCHIGDFIRAQLTFSVLCIFVRLSLSVDSNKMSPCDTSVLSRMCIRVMFSCTLCQLVYMFCFIKRFAAFVAMQRPVKYRSLLRPAAVGWSSGFNALASTFWHSITVLAMSLILAEYMAHTNSTHTDFSTSVAAVPNNNGQIVGAYW